MLKVKKTKQHYLYLYHTLVHVCSQNHSNNQTSQVIKNMEGVIL